MVGVRVSGAVRVRVPLRRPMVSVHGSWPVCDAWLIRLVDDAGRSGLGEATLGPFAAAAEQSALDALVRALVAGDGAGLALPGAGEATEPLAAAVRSAVEGARFDLATVRGEVEPGRSSVTVNALVGAESLPAAVAAARSAVAAGFGTLKLKGGGERSSEELVERLVAIRAAVGPRVGLRLDVNGAWSEAVASERLRAIDDARVDLGYLEQPVAAGPIARTAAFLAELRTVSGGRVPIAADESVTSLAAAQTLIASRAVDALVVKPARVGGPAAALAIAADAARAGISVTIATLLETGVGLLTASAIAARLGPGDAAHGLGTGSLLATDLVHGLTVPVGGCVRAPGGADGWLGVADRLDRAAVERAAVARIGAWA
jgi:o-succinylbenzoate synthase